jgi:hypothetical protein
VSPPTLLLVWPWGSTAIPSPPPFLKPWHRRGFAIVCASCRGTAMAWLGLVPPCFGACRRGRHGATVLLGSK